MLWYAFVQAYGPTEDGRVRSCPSNVNPNCVSTGQAASKQQHASQVWAEPLYITAFLGHT
jgi:hypothetical protein